MSLNVAKKTLCGDARHLYNFGPVFPHAPIRGRSVLALRRRRTDAMSLSRRGFMTRLAPGASDAHAAALIAARGREALAAEALYGEVGELVPPNPREIRISSNENPLGPGQRALD